MARVYRNCSSVRSIKDETKSFQPLNTSLPLLFCINKSHPSLSELLHKVISSPTRFGHFSRRDGLSTPDCIRIGVGLRNLTEKVRRVHFSVGTFWQSSAYAVW